MERNEQSDDIREILAAVAPLLFEQLAAAEWGRLLVLTEPTEDGEGHRICDLQIEDVVGDERRIEAALRSTELGPVFGALAEACQALCEHEDVDLGEVEGGTFVRVGERFGFLPGLVRTPSEGFERLCDERLGPAMERQQKLTQELGVRDLFEVDLSSGVIRFLDEQGQEAARARVALLGSYSERSRSWAWAWGNGSLPPALREPSQRWCDDFPRRDLWELTTPQFATDHGTAWKLAVLLAQHAGADGVYRIPQAHRYVFVLLFGVQAAGPRILCGL